MEVNLTVIMATYNAEEFLEEALQSISQQTYANFKVKIIDDNSSDQTVAILNRWIEKDKRFELVNVNDKNMGLTRNLNRLIELCDTEFLARMDADDIMHPERFKKQIDFLKKHPSTSVVGTWAYNINEESSILSKRYVPTDNNSIKKMVGKASPLIHPSVLMRTKDLKNVNGYNEKYRVAQDLDLWFRMLANNYLLANIPEFLFYYRVIDNHAKKRKMQHRLLDAKIRWNGTKALRFHLLKRIYYSSIPIILGLMPDFAKKIALKFSKYIDPRQRLGIREENMPRKGM